MEISGLVVSDTGEAVIEQSAALFFDTRALFEKWLQSLGTNHQFENGASPTDSEEEKFAETHCEVIFDGVLQVDSLVKANIRSAFGTLVMTERDELRPRLMFESPSSKGAWPEISEQLSMSSSKAAPGSQETFILPR